MKHFVLTFLTLWYFSLTLSAQIINGQDTLYGNEWINFDQAYFKVMVAEDGIYRMGYQVLSDAGVPVTQIAGSEYQLFHNGEEVPLYTSTESAFGTNDYLEFYGKKNRSELDRHLFLNPDEEMMNPLYSLFTDTAAYFLTWTISGTPLRYEEVVNDLTNLPAKENYYLEELVLNFFNTWEKEQNGQGISASNFTVGEGYSSVSQNVQTFTIEPTNPFANGPSANLQIRYSGNLKQHSQLITLDGQTLTTDNFFGYAVRQLDFEIDNAFLGNSMDLKFQGLTDNNDRQRIANIILSYPRLFNFNNSSSYRFNISESGINKYLEIENFNAGNSCVLYDVSNNKRQALIPDNGLVKIKLLPAQADRELLLVNATEGIKPVASISPINFIDYAALDAEFIFLSNPRLYDDGNGNNYVQEYADYRSSVTGGGYQTIIVDVQQVYDQFGWGLNRHALSIRNFGHFVKKEWEEVKYFFVVGKGREYISQRNAISQNNYVPTFGLPGSDNLLLAGSNGFTPIIPIGRIAVSTPLEVRIYLDKVIEHEKNRNVESTIAKRKWMKDIIHLGGGGIATEQALIKNYLIGMEQKIENNLFGGNVNAFYKTSTDPIQVSNTTQIFERINSGVSIITFFGHSAVGAFDFSIDNPDNYKNFGKYPVIFSLGCYSGNIHTSNTGISEKFVFQKDAAALAMVASSGQGYISSLNSLMTKFYDYLGGEFYGESYGKILQETVRFFDGDNSMQKELIQQITFHGDPAIQIFTLEGPDLLINASTLKFSPDRINIRQDSFELEFSVVNIGKYEPDSINMKIEQELPNGDKFIASTIRIKVPSNSTNISLKLSTIGKLAVGRNRLYILLDSNDEIQEYPVLEGEMNNTLVANNGQEGVPFFINDNAALPIFPINYGIVGKEEVTLKASTVDPLLPLNNYIFEIDTSKHFNSPLKKIHTIEQTGGLLEWAPDLNFTTGTVYYWRISPDSIDNENGFSWEYSSFIFLGDETDGWSQGHYFQFLDNLMNDIRLNENNRRFQFIEDFKDFRINNKVYNVADQPKAYLFGIWYQGFFRWDLPQSIHVAVFDTLGTEWRNPNPGLYGSVSTSASNPVPSFPFPVETSEQRENIIKFIEDIVPDNHLVFVYTAQRNIDDDLNVDDWEQDSVVLGGKNLFNFLESHGALQARALKNGVAPYVFGFRKNVGPIVEELAESPEDEINIEIPIAGFWFEGDIQSVIIGPANKWEKLVWEHDPSDISDVDTFYVKVFGLSEDKKNEKLLFDEQSTSEINLVSISVVEYPYLRLEYYCKDEINRSVVQLDSWKVLYTGLPDITLSPHKEFTFYQDTLQEGEMLKVSFNITNPSCYVSDSILVRYTISGENGEQFTEAVKEPALEPESDQTVHFKYSTTGLTGDFQLLIEVGAEADTAELYSFNNFLTKGFHVLGDQKNPLVDVTFDGIKILNGDIVSPRPVINISLVDENEFLLLSDTSVFKIFVQNPAGDIENISLNSPEVSFTPAVSAASNRAMIEFRPVFAESGDYVLIVQAVDISDNQAGDYDYKVSFKVVTESMLSSFLAYPNPFSTFTRFVYTLTGETLPTYFKIQIMTISGRIVREIKQDELGMLKTGTHKTDFAWDGTDEFGDKLANGVYLYKVVALDQERKEFKLFETGTESYFNHGIGKLVIIR